MRVLQIKQQLRAEILCDVSVDACMIAAAYWPVKSIATEYSFPASKSSESHTSCFNSLGKSGNWMKAILNDLSKKFKQLFFLTGAIAPSRRAVKRMCV